MASERLSKLQKWVLCYLWENDWTDIFVGCPYDELLCKAGEKFNRGETYHDYNNFRSVFSQSITNLENKFLVNKMSKGFFVEAMEGRRKEERKRFRAEYVSITNDGVEKLKSLKLNSVLLSLRKETE